MTDSRGGIVAAVLAYRASCSPPARCARAWSPTCCRAWSPAAVLIAIAETRDELLNQPGHADGRRPGRRDAGDHASLIVAATLGAPLRARRADPGASRSPRGPAGSRSRSRSSPSLVVVVAADPVEQWDEFKAVPTGEELASGDVGLLRGGGSGRYQFWETAVDAFAERPGRRRRSQRLHARTGSSTARSRSPRPAPTRSSSRPWPSSGSPGSRCCSRFFACAAVAGVRRLRRAGSVVEAGPALALLVVGFAAAAVDWTWDLPAVFGVTIVAAALLTGPGDAARPPPAPSPRRSWPVRSRRRFAAGVVAAAGRLGLDLRLRRCCCSRRTRSTRAATPRPTATSRRRSTRPTTRSTCSRGRPSRAPQLALVYEQAGDYDAGARGDRRGDRALARRLPPAPARRADGRARTATRPPPRGGWSPPTGSTRATRRS